MVLTTYTRSITTDCPDLDPDLLDAELVAGLSTLLVGGVNTNGDAILCTFEDVLPDVAAFDTILANHGLNANKQKRKKEIDDQTVKLIFQGFTYGGKVFSLSLEAQINWTNAGLNAGALTYPYRVSTKNDADYHDFVDVEDMQGAYGTALLVKASYLSSGAALKNDINDAVDQTALDAVVDTR